MEHNHSPPDLTTLVAVECNPVDYYGTSSIVGNQLSRSAEIHTSVHGDDGNATINTWCATSCCFQQDPKLL